MSGFQKTEFKGYDNEGLDHFYNQEFNNARNRGFDQQKAHEHAKFMVEYYGHQFRVYR